MEFHYDKNRNCYKLTLKAEDYPSLSTFKESSLSPVTFNDVIREGATIVGSRATLASIMNEVISKLMDERLSLRKKDIINSVSKLPTEIGNSNKTYKFGGLNNMIFKKMNEDMFSNIKGSELLVNWYNEENEINNKPSAEVFTDGKTRTRMYETLTGVHILTQDSKVKTVIPAIVKVKPINNRVVIVEFADGTQEKAVLAKEDTFSLEQGISICITKKLLSNIIGSGNGSSVYNKLIDYAIKKYNDDVKYEKELAEIEAKEKQAAEKKERKKKAKEKKQQDKYRQDYIDAICEAVVKAMSEAGNKKE